MEHLIYRVTNFQVVGSHRLTIWFNDRHSQTVNFEPMLVGDVFGPLRELSLFNNVKIDPEVHTLVWPNGADFDPATLHDWPDYEAKLRERAQSWEAMRT